MALALRVTLDQAAHDELDRRYQTTREATTRTRYQMVLLRAEGHPVVEVAQLTRCSPDTVRRVLKRYLASGPDAVPHRPHPGQPPHSPPFVGAGVGPGRRPGPHQVGVDSALWTCRLLADYLAGVTGHRAGSRRSGSRCTARGLWASGPAGSCTARRRRSRGGQTTREGGGTPWGRRSTAASTRSLPGPRCDPGRRPVPGGSAAPARPARPCGPVFARRGRGRPAPDPDAGVVARRPGRAAAGPGARQQRQAVRLWAGGLARRPSGLRTGRGASRGAAGRPAAPRGGPLPHAWADRHGDLRQPGHPHPKGSRLLRALLEELGEQLVLVDTPTYDPDANRIEWLWRALRRTVTHTHQRQRLDDLVADADQWAHTIPQRRCCRRSAARSHPTNSRLSGRNSTMRHELPGSIFRRRYASASRR
jgi:hypothetical protein